MSNNSNDDTHVNEKEKAKRLLEKDTPNTIKNPQQDPAHCDEPEPFRPDENVDNQQAESSREAPHHNTSIKQANIPGVQLTGEKKCHKRNINQKNNKEEPQGN